MGPLIDVGICIGDIPMLKLRGKRRLSHRQHDWVADSVRETSMIRSRSPQLIHSLTSLIEVIVCDGQPDDDAGLVSTGCDWWA